MPPRKGRKRKAYAASKSKRAKNVFICVTRKRKSNQTGNGLWAGARKKTAGPGISPSPHLLNSRMAPSPGFIPQAVANVAVEQLSRRTINRQL